MGQGHELVEPAVLTPPSQNEPNRTQPGVCLPSSSCESFAIPPYTDLYQTGHGLSIPAAHLLGAIICSTTSVRTCVHRVYLRKLSRHTAGTGIIITTDCRDAVTSRTVVLSHACQTRCCADQEARPGRAVFFFPIVSFLENSDVTRLERHVDRSSIIVIAV